MKTGIERHFAELAAEELERKRCEAIRVLHAHLIYDWLLNQSQGYDRLLLKAMKIRG